MKVSHSFHTELAHIAIIQNFIDGIYYIFYVTTPERSNKRIRRGKYNDEELIHGNIDEAVIFDVLRLFKGLIN
jgi:hypothetical protein